MTDFPTFWLDISFLDKWQCCSGKHSLGFEESFIYRKVTYHVCSFARGNPLSHYRALFFIGFFSLSVSSVYIAVFYLTFICYSVVQSSDNYRYSPWLVLRETVIFFPRESQCFPRRRETKLTSFSKDWALSGLKTFNIRKCGALFRSDILDFVMLPAHRLLAGNSFIIDVTSK